MNLFEAIHENAVRCARHYQRAEGALLDALQKVDNKRVFSQMGYASLFEYAIGALNLSESTAYAFLRVVYAGQRDGSTFITLLLGAGEGFGTDQVHLSRAIELKRAYVYNL